MRITNIEESPISGWCRYQLFRCSGGGGSVVPLFGQACICGSLSQGEDPLFVVLLFGGGEQSFFNGANTETHLRGQNILGMFLAGVVQRGPGPDAFKKETPGMFL